MGQTKQQLIEERYFDDNQDDQQDFHKWASQPLKNANTNLTNANNILKDILGTYFPNL